VKGQSEGLGSGLGLESGSGLGLGSGGGGFLSYGENLCVGVVPKGLVSPAPNASTGEVFLWR